MQVLASELAVVIKAPKRNVGASLAALRCGIVHVRGQVNLRCRCIPASADRTEDGECRVLRQDRTDRQGQEKMYKNTHADAQKAHSSTRPSAHKRCTFFCTSTSACLHVHMQNHKRRRPASMH